MKTRVRIIISAILIIITSHISAQDNSNHKSIFPKGIFLGYGQGSYAVKDEYISNEKYSGTLPYYSLEWVRFHNKNGYRLQFEYRKSTEISNSNISTDAQQFSFNQDFIYPAGSINLFSNTVYVYLGPSVQIFYYEIYYRFAQPGTFISPKTLGTIGSLGINTEMIYPVSERLMIEGFLRSNVVSFSSKLIDVQEFENDPSPSLLSVFSATKLDLDLSVRYNPWKRISFSLGYRYDVSRISKWDLYIACSNSIIFSLNLRL